ncbi:ATP-dependent Clp protease adaptor protein ClpS [Fulvitalea axinellae]|uniref:ATP-dependent Clp protease adaptor protein ClpS n=1 Tax=Fulvitalea axinellae TaxID=1182444 RepID=A0AAU9CDV3_9BACT|nr:ATP-dependent Clp protease adaptor protein ClpS [Fulvitalea axinellae]
MTTELEELVLEELISDITRDLMIYNDDYNTFDHVINTLVKVCKHTAEQAEQCAWIIHTKGKYCVKKGAYETLKPMRDAICEAGIDAKIH